MFSTRITKIGDSFYILIPSYLRKLIKRKKNGDLQNYAEAQIRGSKLIIEIDVDLDNLNGKGKFGKRDVK